MPTEAELAPLRASKRAVTITPDTPLYRAAGCPRCNDTGFRGRVGIFQLMVMTDELAHLAAQRSGHDVLAQAALDNGMRTLWRDGFDKVQAGLTSLEEMHRVLV